MATREIVLCEAVRTPIGAYDGSQKTTSAPDLGAIAIKALDRSKLDPAKVGTVVMGNVIQAGNKMNRRGNPTFIVGYRSMFPPCMCVDRWPLFNLTMASPLPVDSF
jgi:acetyl-CoA acetyltransferase